MKKLRSAYFERTPTVSSRLAVAWNMTDSMPLPSIGGPSQGTAVNPRQKASIGRQAICSRRTYLPVTSSVKASSRLSSHHCIGTR